MTAAVSLAPVSLRSTSNASAPASAKAKAMARPRPWAAPVTNATLPLRSNISGITSKILHIHKTHQHATDKIADCQEEQARALAGVLAAQPTVEMVAEIA